MHGWYIFVIHVLAALLGFIASAEATTKKACVLTQEKPFVHPKYGESAGRVTLKDLQYLHDLEKPIVNKFYTPPASPFVREILNKLKGEIGLLYPNKGLSYHLFDDNVIQIGNNPQDSYVLKGHVLNLADARAHLARLDDEVYPGSEFARAQSISTVLHDSNDRPGFPLPSDTIRIVDRQHERLKHIFDLTDQGILLIKANIEASDLVPRDKVMTKLLDVFRQLSPEYKERFLRLGMIINAWDVLLPYAINPPLSVLTLLWALNGEMNDRGVQLPGSVDSRGKTDVIRTTRPFLDSMLRNAPNTTFEIMSNELGKPLWKGWKKRWARIFAHYPRNMRNGLELNLAWLEDVAKGKPIVEAIEKAVSNHNNYFDFQGP